MVHFLSRAIGPLLVARANSESSQAPLASFVAVRRYIDQHLRSPALNVESLVRTFGLSRAALYRHFEPVGGIAAYIRSARHSRAYQEIVAPEFANQRIGPIAFRLGFKNLSAFNRLFKETYGVSPREARFAGSADTPLQTPVLDGGASAQLVGHLGRISHFPRLGPCAGSR